jgi:hypothetical protein
MRNRKENHKKVGFSCPRPHTTKFSLTQKLGTNLLRAARRQIDEMAKLQKDDQDE